MIQLGDRLVPFSLQAVQQRFPETRKDGLNNGHLVLLVREHHHNIRRLQQIVPEIHAENLMAEGFKSSGKYTRQISLREPAPAYEPTLDVLREHIQSPTTIMSIAHPNYTFRSPQEFTQQLPALISQGINAIEINSTATREWVEVILDAHARLSSAENPILLTFGSDCHNAHHDVDRRHDTLADMNPFVPSNIIEDAKTKILQKIF